MLSFSHLPLFLRFTAAIAIVVFASVVGYGAEGDV
jgi:hypothetical protein